MHSLQSLHLEDMQQIKDFKIHMQTTTSDLTLERKYLNSVMQGCAGLKNGPMIRFRDFGFPGLPESW